MTGEYPIVIDGVQTGTLCIRKEGLMTVFEAVCSDPGRLIRLSVYGECEAYLGVMIPTETGKLRLEKQLSRNALRGFPETIRYAGPAGESLPEPEKRSDSAQEVRTEDVLDEEIVASVAEETDLPGEEAGETVKEDDCCGDEALPTTKDEPFSETGILSQEQYEQPAEESQMHTDCLDDSGSEQTKPEPANEAIQVEDEQTVRWRKGAGGALVGSCGDARFLAIPLKAGTIPIWENYEKRRINQVDYAVFEIKNGKIF